MVYGLIAAVLENALYLIASSCLGIPLNDTQNLRLAIAEGMCHRRSLFVLVCL